MRILITGGAGFIGNALALRLLADGHEVAVVDNVNEYYDPSLKEARLKRLPASVSMHRVDITDMAALASVYAAHQPEAVMHLAAQAGVRYSLTDPHAYAQTNYIGTLNVLECARTHAVPHTVIASSSSVYGTSTPLPLHEDARADEPVSIYAASKRATELLAYTYAHLFGLHLTVLRPFTVFGPWSRPDMAALIFAHAMVAGKPITLYNHGDQRRDFTYIDDIVDGFVRALAAPQGYRVYNIGQGRPTPLVRFVELLEQGLGVHAQVTYADAQPGDVFETYADITRARDELGYSPRVSTDEGIAHFVAWFREYYADEIA